MPGTPQTRSQGTSAKTPGLRGKHVQAQAAICPLRTERSSGPSRCVETPARHIRALPALYWCAKNEVSALARDARKSHAAIVSDTLILNPFAVSTHLYRELLLFYSSTALFDQVKIESSSTSSLGNDEADKRARVLSRGSGRRRRSVPNCRL